MEAVPQSQSTADGLVLSGARSGAFGPAAGSACRFACGPAPAVRGPLRRALPGWLALEQFPNPRELNGIEKDGFSSKKSHLRAVLSVYTNWGTAIAAGLALRLWMLKSFFLVNGDALIYGGLAKNLLLHGQYALNGAHGELYPTLIRLPGYPLFLAACFRLFGIENYASAAWVQIGLELAGCLLLADFAGRIAPIPQCSGAGGRRRVALATLWLAALCPFTAVYALQPLTEGLSLFSLAVALWSAARFQQHPAWSSALWFTFAVSYAALLRPDGALVGVALAPSLVICLSRRKRIGAVTAKKPARMAAVCVLLALLPFVAWSGRNWRVFHVFEPLAPRYANDPGETTYPGWQRWVKTWCLDFVSTYDIYWNVPEGPLDVSKLPQRAFDSPRQYAQTVQLAEAYDRNGQEISTQLDARFAQLAEERIRAHPLRYYLWLPLGRLADMGLRPRVENLPIDLDWWVYAHHRAETVFCWGYAGLNALYLLLALAGLWMRPRLWPWMLACLLLRCALLATIEAPEARYTLECFPILFALGGIAVSRALHRMADTEGVGGFNPRE